jgi:autotransporter-associated beta strand protein
VHTTTISGGSLDIKGTINGVQLYNSLQRGITISANIGSNVTNVSQSSEITRIMTLSGTNSYTGKATVNSGILLPTLPTALPGYDSPDRVVFNGGMLLLKIGDWTTTQVDTLLTYATKTSGTLGIDTGAGDLTQWTTFTPTNFGSVGLTKRGANILTLDRTNTYTGVTAVDGGVLRADEGTGLPATSPLIINAGVFETSKDIVRPAGYGTGMMAIETELQSTSVGFSARGGPVKVCFGTLLVPTALTWNSTLSAANTGPFAFGNTNILILNAATADNTIEFLNPFSLVNAARTVQVDANVATISGIISSTTTAGGLTKSGNGTLVLTAINTYTGPTTINAGALRATQGTGLPNNFLKLNGGVYETSGAFTRVNSTTVAGTNFNWIGNNGGGFSAYGGKLTVTIGNDAATEQIFTGTTSANNGIRGTLKFGSATANAETEFQNKIDLVDVVDLVATRTIDVAAGAGGDFATISGVIRNSSGTGSLTKTGGGTLVLTADNTYNGTTTVNGGTLALTGAYTNNIASSPTIRVDDGALLNVTGLSGGTITFAAQRLQGAGTVTGSVIAPSGAVVAPNPVVGGFGIVGNVRMNAGSTYEWALDANTGAALVDITGALTLDTGWKLKLVGSGTPTAKEKYDLFTYTGSFSGDIAGIIDATGVTGWPTPSIIGQDTGRIYVVFGVLPGDTNEDGVVDAADYITLKRNFGAGPGAAGKEAIGDFNGDGNVNYAELQTLMGAMGTGAGGAETTIPEPATLGLLAIGALAVIRRPRAR